MVVPPLGIEYQDYQSIIVANNSSTQTMYLTEDGTPPSATNGLTFGPGAGYAASPGGSYTPGRLGIWVVMNGAGGTVNTSVR